MLFSAAFNWSSCLLLLLVELLGILSGIRRVHDAIVTAPPAAHLGEVIVSTGHLLHLVPYPLEAARNVPSYNGVCLLQEAIDFLDIKLSLQRWLAAPFLETNIEVRGDVRHLGAYLQPTSANSEEGGQDYDRYGRPAQRYSTLHQQHHVASRATFFDIAVICP
ncbi:hypothetical protein KC354_g104 [Hortaea werneckii]|nr:hypothetical protein KC354_g104 [Hortaea werneckii]